MAGDGAANNVSVGLTVRRMLSLPELPKMKLVAGEEGLNNIVENVSVYEVADAYKWFRGHEVIITTFLSVPASEFPNIIAELAARNIAAIVLCYPEIYYGDVPDGLIHLCDNYSIPLLTVTQDVAYVDIMVPILREIIGNESSLLYFKVKIMNEYNRLLLNGAPFIDFLAFIHKFLLCPVLLLDVDYEPVAYQASSEIEMGQINTFINKQLPGFVAKHEVQIEEGSPISVVNSRIPVQIYPIVSNSTFLGALVLFREDSLTGEPYLVVEQGLHALAILFINRYADTRHYDNLKHELAQLIVQEYQTKDQINLISERLSVLGLSPTEQLRLALISTSDSFKNPRLASEKARRKFLNACLNAYYPRTILLEILNGYLLVMPCPSSKVFATGVDRFVREIETGLGDILFTVSPLIMCSDDIPRAYRLISGAASIVPLLEPVPKHVIWAEDIEPWVYLEGIINRGIGGKDLYDWAVRKLAPIIEYDAKKGSDLLATLRMLLLERGNLQVAAERLFVHKNTLIYRKHLIERLLGEQISENQLYYALAAIILKLGNETRG